MATAVSACFVRAGKVGGAEHALYNLLDGLRTVTAADPWSVVTAEPLNLGFDLAPLVARPVHARGLRNRVAIEAVSLPTMRDVDRWLLPNYFTPAGLRGRVVTVIHDAQYAHFPENFSPLKRAWLRAAHRHTMRRADVVVAISTFVADDLLRLHGSKFASKVVIIPNAVSFDRLEPGELPAGIPSDREVVLCVSGGYRHKNLDTLVRAFRAVAARRPQAHLVIVGQQPDRLIGARPGANMISLIAEPQLADRVTLLGYVTDPELGALYRRATLVTMPSLFEGFGLPVVEALGLGVPVVSTSAGALADVDRGLAVHTENPLDQAELADALLGVLSDPKAVAPTSGEQNALRDYYSPQRVATQHVELLVAN